MTLQRDKDRYFVCEKSDGTRYLLLIDGRRGSYLVERTYRFCEVNLRVPDRKRPGEFLEDTLLDGEMVEDHEGPEVRLHGRNRDDGVVLARGSHAAHWGRLDAEEKGDPIPDF